MAYKILVADDEPDVPDLIRMMFRSKIKSGEIQFDFAENGEHALKKLAEDPAIDLLFTDINMPVMDGLTLLNKLKELDHIQKAVVISAYGDLKNIRTAMNRGAFDFVTKPIDREDLEVTLKKAMDEMQVFRQGLEARKNLAAAQQQALEAMQEKERLILYQNELLERQVTERTLEVIQQKEIIEIKNREIIDSIQYAKRLQEAILPPEKLVKLYFPFSFIYYLPKDIVAGDFYWVDADDEYIWFAVADCTGHGVAGALMSMLGVSLLNQIVREKQVKDPSQILEHLNEGVIKALKQEETEGNEGMDILLCRFDLQYRRCEFAGANRPLWMIRNDELHEFKTDKLPIGGLQFGEKKFNIQKIDLQKGDRLYLFTDGYADQFGGESGKKFMTKKLKELLIRISSRPVQVQKTLLANHFIEWKGEMEQVDDVLVAGIAIDE